MCINLHIALRIRIHDFTNYFAKFRKRGSRYQNGILQITRIESNTRLEYEMESTRNF